MIFIIRHGGGLSPLPKAGEGFGWLHSSLGNKQRKIFLEKIFLSYGSKNSYVLRLSEQKNPLLQKAETGDFVYTYMRGNKSGCFNWLTFHRSTLNVGVTPMALRNSSSITDLTYSTFSKVVAIESCMVNTGT